LDTGILVAVVVAGGNDMAMELAADLDAILFDGSLGANLHGAVFNSFNQINGNDFFECHDFSFKK
jgi:hypothetical protein